MSQKNIRIENLRIRLPKGFSASSARQLAADLGRELSSQMARKIVPKRGEQRIENLDAGKIKHSGSGNLQDRMARRIVEVMGERGK